MKLLVFTVYDSAVAAFMQPFFSRSQGEAIRSFQDACNDTKSNFFIHASDYTLFHLGSYDDASGIFDTLAPVRVTSALELKIEPGVTTFDPEAPIKMTRR